MTAAPLRLSERFAEHLCEHRTVLSVVILEAGVESPHYYNSS
jgi:hypothetical protein